MFKRIILQTIAIGVISVAAFAVDHSVTPVEQFENDWKNKAHTSIKLEDVDVNEVLTTYYTTSKPIHFTRTMLWDLECKKSWDPQTYIPHVVRAGKSWGKEVLENGDVTFTRLTQQRQWLTGEYADVIEKVYPINKDQKVLFFGMSSALNEDGQMVQTSGMQPLFHVEHGVSGTEENPLNTWRIVHLTLERDENLIERFKNFADPKTLPKYVEVYIEKDLSTTLTKKQ